MRPFDESDESSVAALRVLAIDQVERAHSGHPGMPLGAAPMAYVLWKRFLRFDSGDPTWPDRDRFVLSAGHGSALLYALLHLFGFDLPLAELERFRQWGSRTPGHPEHGLTPGVEVTTGPLGQGFGAAVGMALAERHLAARFNRESFPVIDHRTWVIASDGDLMEGLSHEAASLAGHLRLGRLAVLYDDNRITIEGATPLAFSEHVPTRFAGYGWRVIEVEDGNDLGAIAGAVEQTIAAEDAPTLIRVHTHIGFGSPKQDSAEVHGAPLGAEAWAATRRALGWTVADPFVVPDAIRSHFGVAAERGREAHRRWLDLFDRYRADYPDLATELERRWRGDLPPEWTSELPSFPPEKPLATREASGKTLNAIAPHVPELVGGSADLAPSNNTLLAGEADLEADEYGARNLHFGIREHAMAALANGMALHGGVRPYVGTFLVFSDYLRPALRLAALQKLPVVFVFTHDSIALGEDGPTHQPIEHIVALRLIPNLVVLRPADANETVEAWRVALARRDGPTALLLSRQKLPVLAPTAPGDLSRGAFVRVDAAGGAPEVVLIATGSEVSLALAVRQQLAATGVHARVVSAPSLELFGRQDADYQRAVLGPRHALRVAIEMGRGQGWHRWVGDGEIISLNRFGASAPGGEVARELGFGVDAVVERVGRALATRRPAPQTAQIPPQFRPRAAQARERLAKDRATERLIARDATLWGERHAAVASRRLGWLGLPARTRHELPELERIVAGLVEDGVGVLYLLGMGGSSLAPQVLRDSVANPSGRELVVLDTTDPDRIGAALRDLDPARAAVLAVSKSGGTVETSALLEAFWHAMAPRPGGNAARRFLALTEPGTPLAALARGRGFRAVITHPVDVGGRYSALSSVGILPALWLGLDAEAILDSAGNALAALGDGHPAVELAVAIAAATEHGWGTLAWCSPSRLHPLGRWAEQLVAESTGKDGRGVLPLVLGDAPAGMARWPGTAIVAAGLDDRGYSATGGAFAGVEGALPAVHLSVPPDRLGEAFMVLELATALVALLIEVNPFDEPDVTRAKERARAVLAQPTIEVPVPASRPADAVASHLSSLKAEDAVVLLAYLPERREVEAALGSTAEALSAATRVPVTVGFGPRYLHSTGQLHKGGGDRIVPIVLSADPVRDVAVPGQPHTFGELRLAQALGDVAALREAGRRVLHLHLGAEPLDALAAIRRTFTP
jgi:transketolase